MTKPDDLSPAQRVEFRRWQSLGLSESSALIAMGQDRGADLSGPDRLVESFRSLGLSEAAARTAARGRGDDPMTTSTVPAYFSEDARQAKAALDSMTDAEIEEMARDHRRQAIAEAKKRKPAKSQPAKSAASTRRIDVAEPAAHPSLATNRLLRGGGR